MTGGRGGTPRARSGRRPAASGRRGPRRTTTRIETRARARALQALYAWDVRRGVARRAVDLRRVAEEIWDDLVVPAAERRAATRLIRGVASDARGLDAALADVMTNWRLERLGVIERAVLRLGAGELAAGETPPRVVIHEAVRLAERYGSVESARFVNGVLDGLARATGKL